MNESTAYTAQFLDDEARSDARPNGPKGCIGVAKLLCSVKLCIGNLYLAGGLLLLPGFLWIIPEKVVAIPLPNNTSITVPEFERAVYTQGVHVLIAGMICVLVAAAADLVLVHAGVVCRHTPSAPVAPNSQDTARRQARVKPQRIAIASSIAQVLGAAALLAGCVVFLLMFSLSKPPRTILGQSAPDLGNDLFQAGAALYFVGAILAIVVTCSAISRARTNGQGTALLWASVVAFLLFICTSCLFFVNGRLPAAEAILAGRMRLAASICLLCAICLLYAITAAEVVGSHAPSTDKHNAGYASSTA